MLQKILSFFSRFKKEKEVVEEVKPLPLAHVRPIETEVADYMQDKVSKDNAEKERAAVMRDIKDMAREVKKRKLYFKRSSDFYTLVIQRNASTLTCQFRRHGNNTNIRNIPTKVLKRFRTQLEHFLERNR